MAHYIWRRDNINREGRLHSSLQGKQQRISLGSYPALSLKQARQAVNPAEIVAQLSSIRDCASSGRNPDREYNINGVGQAINGFWEQGNRQVILCGILSDDSLMR